MTTVYWTPEARTRLKEIQNYIVSQDAAKAAKKVVTALLSRTRQLETVPLSGHKIPDYRDDHVREILLRPYRIIYRITERQVENSDCYALPSATTVNGRCITRWT